MGGQLVSTGFQTDWCNTIWAWCFFPLLLPEDLGTSSSLIWSVGVGERGVAWGVNGYVERCSERVWGVFQTCSRTHSDRLPVVDSPQCWGMVSCSWWSLSDLSTLMPSRWKWTESLVFQNNSTLPLWSPFPVCIWPVYTRLCPPSCKHLLWPDGAFWVLQWTTVCRCCKLDESWQECTYLHRNCYKMLQSLWARPDHWQQLQKHSNQ